ncbi:MAG: hypothetical protein KDA79_15215, partial [Planctomycetaceae bacterium]|nr:hypothetical protein [Planctomycetaceae bacterium]
LAEGALARIPAQLVPLTDLVELRLSGETVTDEVLASVAELPVLRRLVLSGTSVTRGGLRRLSRQRPQLKVTRQP